MTSSVWRARWQWIWAGLWLVSGLVAAAPRPQLTVGIVPQLPAWTLARRWAPVLAAWSRACGCALSFETAPTIAAFERRVAAGRYDVVYLNPEDYLRNRTRYRPFARGAGWLRGVLVVRRGSGIRDVSQLAGRALAFPAAHALAASVQPQWWLASRHIRFRPHYVGSHLSVYLGVARGLFVAGGGVEQTLRLARPALRAQLRILWRGPRTLPHPFLVRRSLPKPLRQQIAEGLLHLPASLDPALARLGFTGFVAARDRDYWLRGPGLR